MIEKMMFVCQQSLTLKHNRACAAILIIFIISFVLAFHL